MTLPALRRLLLVLTLPVLAVTAAGCPGGGQMVADAALGPSLLPEAADYAARFVEVRDCRQSVEHLGYIRITVARGQEAAYERGPYPLPEGTLIVKEEFPLSDRGCTARTGWTVMRKQPPGYDADHGDWQWQRLDAGGQVIEDGRVPRCASCHARASCKARDFACAEP
jgi:hypothetical protein